MKKLLLSFLLTVLAATGFAQWSANPRANTPVAVRENSQSSASSVSDGAGGVIIFYGERVQDPISLEFFSLVYAQRLSASGVSLWGTMGKLVVTVPDYADKSIVADGAGGAVILYTKLQGGGSDLGNIYAQRIDANGNKLWGNEGVAITAVNKEYGISDNILRDAAGNYAFAYTDYDTNQMFAQKLNSAGQLQWAGNIVLNEGVSDEAEGGFIFQDGAGYIVLWAEEYEDLVEDEDAGRLKWQRLNADGTKNGSNLLIYDLAPSAGLRREISGLTTDGSGGYYMALVEFSNTTAKLYLQRVLSDGTKTFNATTWGMEIDASMGKLVTYSGGNYMDYGVALESDGTGGVVVGWTDTRSSNLGIYAQRFNAAGQKLWASGDLPIFASSASTNFYDGHIKKNADGDFIFMINKDLGSGQNHIYVQKVPLSGGISYNLNGSLVAGSSGSKYAEMIISDNKAILVWDEYRTNASTYYDVYAQSIFNNGSLTGTFPVKNMRNGLGFNTIQEAVSDLLTTTNDEIQIAAGTYTENVIISKTVRLKGSNAGVAPWNWTLPVTVIRPSATDFTTNPALFKIEVSDVTVDGIRFDGVNNDLNDAAPRNINGQASRAGLGVLASTTSYLGGVEVMNCDFLNLSSRGIYIGNTSGGGSTGVYNSRFDNVASVNNGIAISIFINNLGAYLENNRITRTDQAFLHQTTYTNVLNPLVVKNNQASVYRSGFRFSGFNNSSNTAIEVSGNVVNQADYTNWTADGLSVPTANNIIGLYIANLFGTQPILIKNNNITGLRNGIFTTGITRHASNLDRFLVDGGTYSNNYIGIYIYNTGNTFANTRAVISGATIRNSDFVGVLSEDETATGVTTSELVLRNGVLINQTGVVPSTYSAGVQIFGARAILRELNDTKISGAQNNFIRIFAPAMTGLTVDGKDVTYDGTTNGQTFNNYKPSAAFNLALRNAVKSRITDGEDAGNETAGIVTIPSTLPVSLTDFNASLKNNGALITWSTASELNNKQFVIEKSADGISFQLLTTIDGKGTTAVKSNYQFTDVNFFQSAYYRLTQVDLNGTKTVYDELIRHVKGLGEDKITVYPNPAVEKINVKLPVSVANTTVKLIDVNGKVLDSKSANGGQTLTFAVQHLPKGVYLVQYADGGQLQTQKVVKH